MSPYSTYATVLIAGPLLAPLLAHLEHGLSRRREETQFQCKQPKDLIWSFSRTGRPSQVGGEEATGDGDATGHGILRVAAKDTESCRGWLKQQLELGGVKELVGGDAVWERCM